jgi:RecB family exonuclease
VPLPDGRRLSFRGSADRIDRTEEGELLVIDYKTGRSDKYRGLSEHNPDDRGTRLQLLVYGLAARSQEGCEDAPVQAQYWFVNEREPLTPIGYEVTDDVLRRVGNTLATITDGISAGVFPAHPTETATDPFVRCHYCNPDGLGVGDRKRAWDLKKSDPALLGYVQLAEPDPEAA